MTDILIGRHDRESVSLDPHDGNRHGMIPGAAGTGKSVSQMVRTMGGQLGRQVLRGALDGIFGGKR